MNAAKRDHSGVFRPQGSLGKGHRRNPKSVRISATGVTFSTPTYMAPFTEVQVRLRSTKSSEPIQYSGVVVDCRGDRSESQYMVSVAFLNVPRNAERELRHTTNPSSNQVFLTHTHRPNRVSS